MWMLRTGKDCDLGTKIMHGKVQGPENGKQYPMASEISARCPARIIAWHPARLHWV